MAIKTKISKPADDTDSLIKDTVDGIDAIASQGLEPLLDDQGNPVQLAGRLDKAGQVATEIYSKIAGGGTKVLEKVSPTTAEIYKQAPAIKEQVEGQSAKIDAEINQDIIQRTTGTAATDNTTTQPIENIVQSVNTDGPLELQPQIIKDVQAAIDDPSIVVRNRFDSREELESYLQKNAGINIEKPASISISETEELAVVELANKMDVPATVLKQNGILNSQQVVAAAQIMEEIQKENFELATFLSENPGKVTPEMQLQQREGLMKEAAIRQYFLGARSEIGRTLNVFKQIKQAFDNDATLMTAQTVQNEFGGTTGDLANGYINAYNLGKESGQYSTTQQFAEATYGQKVWKAISSHYYGMMLANPATNLRNILGNLGFQSLAPIEYTVAGLLNAGQKNAMSLYVLTGLPGSKTLVPGMLKNMGGSIQQGEGFARLIGMMRSFPAALRMAGHSIRTGEKSTGRGQIGLDLDSGFTAKPPMKTSEFDNFSSKNLITDKYKNVPGMNIVAGAIDAWGKVLNVGQYGLLAGDEFFKEVARHAELASLSVRNLKETLESGATKEEAIKSAAYVMANPNNIQKGALDEAAEYYTFQTKLDAISEKTKLIQRIPGMIMIVPFYDVLINLAKITMTYTPGVNVPGLIYEEGKFLKNSLIDAYPDYYKKWERAKRDPKKKGILETRALVSVGLAFYVHSLLEENKMIGSVPQDAEARAAFYDAGKVPFSFPSYQGDWKALGHVDAEGNILPMFDENNLPNGPLTYRSFVGIEPFSAALGITIAAWENLAYYGVEDPSGFMGKHIVQAYLAATYEYAEQQPLLKGIAELSRIVGGSPSSQFKDDPSSVLDRDFASLLGNPGSVVFGFGSVGSAVSGLTDDRLKVVNPDFPQDLEVWKVRPAAENNWQGVLNDDFGKFYPNSAANQFNRLTYKTFKNYNPTKNKSRVDIFGKPFHVNSGRGFWGDVRNKFLPLAVSDRKKPDDVTLEMLRLHAVLDWNGMTTNRNANLFGKVRLTDSETVDFHIMMANNNNELFPATNGKILMPLKDAIDRVINTVAYQAPQTSKAYAAFEPNVIARSQDVMMPDKFRKQLLQQTIEKYRKASMVAYYRADAEKNGAVSDALQSADMETDFDFPSYTTNQGTKIK